MKLKCRVYCAPVHSFGLYGCETWSSLAEDVYLLEVFEHRCLPSITKTGCSDHVSDVAVKNLALGTSSENTFSQCMNFNRLR